MALAAERDLDHALALEVGPETRELAMSEDSVLGLLAWLEAAPPGIASRQR